MRSVSIFDSNGSIDSVPRLGLLMRVAFMAYISSSSVSLLSRASAGV